MDPLSALAIATAVVQFAEFGGKILVRTWDKYKTYKGPDAARQIAQESAELSEIANELSTLARAVQDNSQEFVSENQVSAVESQFMRLCTECDSIDSEFQGVLNRIRNRKRRPGKDTEEREKKKIIRFPLAGMWDAHKIEHMSERLESLRSQIMSAILFCLWADSKKTKQWELHFTRQLDGMLDILRRVETSTTTLDQDSTSIGGSKPTIPPAQILNDVCGSLTHVKGPASEVLKQAGKSRGKLTEAILPLIQARQSISLASVENEVVKILNGNISTDMAQIRGELIQLLWDKRWSLDSSMATGSMADYQAQTEHYDISQEISKGLYFESMHDREDSVANNFEATYEWIFQREPKQENGKPLWASFPEWLECGSKTPYWITGKPGSGKSTIMKLIARHSGLRMHLLPWAGSLPIVITNYYAWNSGFNMQKAWEGLKKTVLHQVLNQKPSSIPRIAPRRWALFQALRDPQSFPAWETWEVDESFEALLKECGKSMAVALFVDGLDEFEMPPAEVVSRICATADSSAGGIKICVASRPWTEFDDAFNDGPMLQMHLLTQDDMTTFVSRRFQGNRGYIELKHIYPQEATQLTEDVVLKANGVFLWVSLVVIDLIDLLTAGDSIAQLQETLDRLPSDLSSLYDAIWERIPTRHLLDACVMIRLSKAAYGPTPWLLMWLADECRSMQVSVNAMSLERKFHARKALKRRLATRTRGILELSQAINEVVNFSHRTARDWAAQSHVWERICSSCPEDFEPNLLLLKAESLLMADDGTTSDYAPNQLWLAVMRALWYASQVPAESSPAILGTLIQTLEDFDEATLEAYRRVQQTWPEIYRIKGHGTHWSSRQDIFGHRQGLPNTFLGLVAQFSILPYVKDKVQARRSFLYQWAPKNSIGLLENAVFGYKYYMGENFKPPNGLPYIPSSQRLATVRFLLGQGVQQSKVHGAHGMVSIKHEVRRFASQSNSPSEPYDGDAAYFSEVSGYLDKAGALQCTFRRFKSVLQD
ncbi:Fc.00g041660.m01.CDS01 [Cosmosporella sp. VM-42]